MALSVLEGDIIAGAICWKRKVKTTNYTIVRGDGAVYMDTDGGNRTVTLPSDAVAGDLFLAKNWGVSGNSLTVARNGKDIERVAANRTLADMKFEWYEFVGTAGWGVIASG